jgi:hypothetical protein
MTRASRRWPGIGGAVAAAAFPDGAGNGDLSLTRGTLPLLSFDVRSYGAFVGHLLVPRFVFSAVSPLAFAAVIEHSGGRGVLYLSIAMSAMTRDAASRSASIRLP